MKNMSRKSSVPLRRPHVKKHKKVNLSLLLFSVFLLLALLPSGPSSARPITGTLTGLVLNKQGKPVANTKVYVFQRDWTLTDGFGTPDWKTLVAQTTTSRNGQYKFSIPAGEYRVWFVPEDLQTYAM